MTNESIGVLVIDDESLARDLIVEMLKDYEEFQLLGECRDGLEAVKTIRKTSPDLIFLDVQMPLMNGLDVLEEIKDENLPEIIFVTAFDRYAVRAFDFHAVDYLLKPFSRSRFRRAVLHARERIIKRSDTFDSERPLFSLLESHKNKHPHLRRIFVKDRGRIVLLEPETIDWIEAQDKYLNLHTERKTYLIRQTLNAIESELDPRVFLRIHRSTIVNLLRVKEIHPLFNSEYALVLDNKTKLTLSRHYKTRFFERFGKTL